MRIHILMLILCILLLVPFSLYAEDEWYQYSSTEIQNLSTEEDSAIYNASNLGLILAGLSRNQNKFYFVAVDSCGRLLLSNNDTLNIFLPSYSEFVGDTLYATASEDSIVFSSPLRQFSFYTDTNTEDIWFKLNDQANWIYLASGKSFNMDNILLSEFKYKRKGSTNVLIIYEGVK